MSIAAINASQSPVVSHMVAGRQCYSANFHKSFHDFGVSVKRSVIETVMKSDQEVIKLADEGFFLVFAGDTYQIAGIVYMGRGFARRFKSAAATKNCWAIVDAKFTFPSHVEAVNDGMTAIKSKMETWSSKLGVTIDSPLGATECNTVAKLQDILTGQISAQTVRVLASIEADVEDEGIPNPSHSKAPPTRSVLAKKALAYDEYPILLLDAKETNPGKLVLDEPTFPAVHSLYSSDSVGDALRFLTTAKELLRTAYKHSSVVKPALTLNPERHFAAMEEGAKTFISHLVLDKWDLRSLPTNQVTAADSLKAIYHEHLAELANEAALTQLSVMKEDRTKPLIAFQRSVENLMMIAGNVPRQKALDFYITAIDGETDGVELRRFVQGVKRKEHRLPSLAELMEEHITMATMERKNPIQASAIAVRKVSAETASVDAAPAAHDQLAAAFVRALLSQVSAHPPAVTGPTPAPTSISPRPQCDHCIAIKRNAFHAPEMCWIQFPHLRPAIRNRGTGAGKRKPEGERPAPDSAKRTKPATPQTAAPQEAMVRMLQSFLAAGLPNGI